MWTRFCGIYIGIVTVNRRVIHVISNLRRVIRIRLAIFVVLLDISLTFINKFALLVRC